MRMAYDSSRARVIAEGYNPNDGHTTWEWDGTNWTVSTTPYGPGPVVHGSMCYDSRSGRLVYFGGNQYGYGAVSFDTWELASTYYLFGSGCSGPHGQLRIEPNQYPVLGSPFSIRIVNMPYNQPGLVFPLGLSRERWGLLGLPLSLAAIGMPGCTLSVSGEVPPVGLMPTIFGLAVWGFQMPSDAFLYGSEFYNQVFYLDPGSNAAGVISSNGGQATIGR